MRRLRVRDPSGLCWAGAGPISSTMGSQKRSIMERYPRGELIGRHPSRRPRKKKQLAFEMPDVVLDLDAEDSPHVRPFDAQDEAEQKVKWGFNPVVPEVEERVSELTTDMLTDGTRMRQMLAARHHPFKISDHDVLSVALLGGDATAPLPADGEAVDEGARRHNTLLQSRNRALQLNGIPERIQARDPNTIIHFMLHRQQLASASQSSASTSAQAKTTGSDTFERAVHRCKSHAQLERLCSSSMSSGHGAISPASLNYIADVLETPGKLFYGSNTQQVLKFVNNFTMRQLSTNTGLNSRLSLLGLLMAANLRLLPAVMQYLHICLSQGFIGNAQDKPETLSAVGDGILKALEQGQGLARGVRPELFTLLTGRTLAVSTVQPALFGSSVVSSEEDPHTHPIYVQILGQLGAFRLLWHSWRRGADERMRQYEPYYYRAFIRCAEVLHDAKSINGLDCTTATGDLEKDAELDLQAIDALDAQNASSSSTTAPYTWHIETQPSWDEIIEVFESAEIHQAVARIDELVASAPMESAVDVDNVIEGRS
ncbi:hypothetical protein Daus18300_013302 [Diaporthe australafricana]|uniref:Uncharacterized protein n=1 Tax=Diaporthe australafricana TaxID=127596 RepID=A0ABR3VZK8_9PEZI